MPKSAAEIALQRFEALSGRKAMPKEQAEIRRVVDIMGTSSATTAGFIGFQVFATNLFHQSAEHLAEAVNQASKDAVKSANAEATKMLASAVRTETARSTGTIASRAAARWVIGAVLIMALAFGGAAWFVNRNYQAALAKLETVVSADAKTRQTAAFMDSEMGKKVFALKEKGELGQLLDFAESKVGAYAIRAYGRDELKGLLKFALSPAGKMARGIEQDELREILERVREEQGKN